MLKLHGARISNFYCMVKQVLIEKGIAFEEVETMPNQEPAFLAKSPMGKVPALETEHGFLTETNVIFDYLEDVQPTPALYPNDAFARARCRQIVKMTELYVEGPAHALLPALFGQSVADFQRDSSRPMMQRGLAALRQLVKFSPWVCGEQYTFADIFLYRSLGVITITAEKLYDWEVLAELPGIKDWQARMAQRSVTQTVDAENQSALAVFMQQLNTPK
jgi:glutathione S-transferase